MAQGKQAKPERINVLVTGTPGVGKTRLCERLADELGLTHVDVGKFAVERGLVDGFDARRQCHVLDEDKILDELEKQMLRGHVLLDHHSPEWFPERWFALVVVPRCSTEVLFQRLQRRGYSEEKLRENVECEIMQVSLDGACEAYPKATLVELSNDDELQQQALVDAVRRELQRLAPQREHADGQRRRGDAQRGPPSTGENRERRAA